MNTLQRISCGAVLIASVAGMACIGASAQTAGKQVLPKTVYENDKIAIMDNILKPGDTSPSADRAGMFYYYIQGGTVERTFADGTKETVVRKTGQALQNPEKRPYAVENTGKNTVRVISIKLK
jgi:hypothetical protein